MEDKRPAAQSYPLQEDVPHETVWGDLIPPEQWQVLLDGTDAISRAGVRFLLGGALALATYTGHWRNTKDVDIIIHAADSVRAIEAIKAAGFEDYYEREAYDRSWIFRGYKDGVIFDVIWDLPNHRVQIDDEWFSRSRSLRLRDFGFAAVGPEELVRVKLYVLQRTRCDWVDVLNVLAGATSIIDWDWLVARMGRDLPLLHAVLAIFNWMCPARAREIPETLRTQFALPPVEDLDLAAMEERRTRLFDSRPWFAMHQPTDKPLEL
jgi:Uncharacterised nucleotidyltransferase